MFYKPNYCSHCGEPIEREAHSFAANAMFCDVCKHDFVPQRVAPVIFAAVMGLVGLFGAGAMMRGTPPPVVVATRNVSAPAGSSSDVSARVPAGKTPPPRSSQESALPASTLRPPPGAPGQSDEDTSICGAMTKKGTPCTRRVRGGGRCWQHRDAPPAGAAQK